VADDGVAEDRGEAATALFDVAIVGGGLVGASLAVALADGGRRVVLIEAAEPPRSAPAWDERCIALGDASRAIFAGLGVWDSLRHEAEPIRATHISERGRFGVARFEAAEAGLDALGWNTPLRLIGATLWQRAQAATNVTLRCPARVVDVQADAAGVVLRLDGEADPLRARLLVAADGARSAMRERLGVSAATRDYGQHAIVSAVELARPHRGVAYERFTPDGPIALVPKPGDRCSLIWTTPQAQVEARMQLDDAAFLAAAQEVFGQRLGRFRALGRRSHYPLARVLAERLERRARCSSATPRRACTRRRRRASISACAMSPRSPGACARSRTPARRRCWRRTPPSAAVDREAVSGMTDFMVRTFSNRVPLLAQARHWGLLVVELGGPLRRRMLRQHLGYLGAPPERLP
jgi:Ubiquinone biosynthesis hydroxylase, UbiH/UbiF/VisC/COQ6 family